MHTIMRPASQSCYEHRLGRPYLLSTARQPVRPTRLQTCARRRQRSVELGPEEDLSQQALQQLPQPQTVVHDGPGRKELADDLWQQPRTDGEARQPQELQQQQEQHPVHQEALETRQAEQHQRQHQQEQGWRQVEVGPEECQRTAEVSAEGAMPTRAEAWQAVHGYARQLEVQATRSPATVVSTVAAVAVGAALLGSLLRRYLFKPSPARAPTLEELVLRYREQTGELRPVRGQGPVPEPTAEAKEAAVLELGPLVQEKDEWTAEKEARALRLEQIAAQAAAEAAGGAAAATIDVEATAAAEPLAGEQRGGAVASPGVAPSQNGAAPATQGAGSQSSTASRETAVSQAATAEPAVAEPAVAEPAAREPVPAAAVHPLAVQPEVFIVRQGAKSKAGVRIMFELEGQQQYCPLVFQDQEDAQALRGPLATLFGAILTPEDLPVVATPTASLLQLAAEGGQALAFYPAGALLQLSFYSEEALAEAVEDEDKAQQFDDELQQLLRKQGQVLPPALVRQLAQQSQQRAKLEQERQRGGVQQAQQQQQQQQQQEIGLSQQDSSGPSRRHQEQEEQQQGPGQSEHVQGHQPEEQQHAGMADAATAATAQGTGAAAAGAGALAAPLPMDWWLSLPVVHVPQLCYADGAQGLMVVPVASLSGALRKAAGAFGGGSSGQESGSSGRSSSSSGSGSGGNGAVANSNGGPARDPHQSQEERGQQGDLSRPVERHVVAFKDLDDARALSLCALKSQQGGNAIKVQALALQPQQLLRLAQSAGCTVTVLPKGAVPVSPGDQYEVVVARLHDAVQDMYWARLAEGLKALDEAEEQQREEGGKGEA